MRTRLQILVFLIAPVFIANGQVDFQIHHHDFVECYYSDKAHYPILVYDSIEGNIIDTLETLQNRCWYKLAIQKSDNYWFEIENLMTVPNCPLYEVNKDIYKYQGNWVKYDNLIINLPLDGAYLYSEPDTTSEKLLIPTFTKANVFEIKGRWAKVRIMSESNLIFEGWLKRSDQCALPYTTCNYEWED